MRVAMLFEDPEAVAWGRLEQADGGHLLSLDHEYPDFTPAPGQPCSCRFGAFRVREVLDRRTCTLTTVPAE